MSLVKSLVSRPTLGAFNGALFWDRKVAALTPPRPGSLALPRDTGANVPSYMCLFHLGGVRQTCSIPIVGTGCPGVPGPISAAQHAGGPPGGPRGAKKKKNELVDWLFSGAFVPISRERCVARGRGRALIDGRGEGQAAGTFLGRKECVASDCGLQSAPGGAPERTRGGAVGALEARTVHCLG